MKGTFSSKVWLFLLLVAVWTTVSCSAFVLPPGATQTSLPTSSNPSSLKKREPNHNSPPPTAQQQSFTSTGWDSFERLRTLTDLPSGEGQRKFRRTVYSHDDWKKHRSQDRFIWYLQAIFSSGVYKNLGREVALTTAVAVFVCAYNALVGGYTNLDGVVQPALLQSQYLPKLGLPLASFTLTSPSLGLLLGTYCVVDCLVYVCWFLSLQCFSYTNAFLPLFVVSTTLVVVVVVVVQSCSWLLHTYLLPTTHSLSYQHILSTMGRSPQELGNEH